MKLVVHEFASLDGVMQGPGAPEEDPSNGFARGGWLVPHSEGDWGHIVDGWFQHVEAILLGRRTFEMMRGYWSQVTDSENRVAVALNTRPKYLASSTLADEDAAWGNTRVLRGNVVEQVRRLKDQPGGELQVHGSWQLVQTLHHAGLVDIYRVLQFPVVVGDGKQLFAHKTPPAAFTVTDSHLLAGGIMALTLHQDQFEALDVGQYAMPREGKEVRV